MHVSKSICKICVIYKTQYVEKLKMVSLGLINHKSNTSTQVFFLHGVPFVLIL